MSTATRADEPTVSTARNVNGDPILFHGTLTDADRAIIATMVEPYDCDDCGAFFDEGDGEEHSGLCDTCQTSPTITAEARGPRTVQLHGVDPTGPFLAAERDALAAIATGALDQPLEAWTSWTVTRYSLDRTAVVAFHKD